MKLICPEIDCGRHQLQIHNLKHDVKYFYCTCGFKLLPQNRVDPKSDVTQIEINNFFEQKYNLKINLSE